jgi:DNA-binding MarR family transcriptional regulator
VFITQTRERFAGIRSELDLSRQQATALHVLDPTSPLPTNELAEQIFCDASNVTGVVDRLESKGLVERRPSPGDRRVKLIALTRKGARLRERLHELLATPPTSISGLSASDQRALRDLLRRALASG